MDELIKSVVGELGLDEGVTRDATGSLFGFIKEGMGGDFSQIADKLPGVDDLISGASGAQPPAATVAVEFSVASHKRLLRYSAVPWGKASNSPASSKSWASRRIKLVRS